MKNMQLITNEYWFKSDDWIKRYPNSNEMHPSFIAIASNIEIGLFEKGDKWKIKYQRRNNSLQKMLTIYLLIVLVRIEIKSTLSRIARWEVY